MRGVDVTRVRRVGKEWWQEGRRGLYRGSWRAPRVRPAPGACVARELRARTTGFYVVLLRTEALTRRRVPMIAPVLMTNDAL